MALKLLVNQMSSKGAARQNYSHSLTANIFINDHSAPPMIMFWLLPCIQSDVSTVHSEISDVPCKCKTVFTSTQWQNPINLTVFGLYALCYLSVFFLARAAKSGDFTKMTYFQWFTKTKKKKEKKKRIMICV